MATEENKIFNKNDTKIIRQSLRQNMPLPEVILWQRIKAKQLLGLKFRRQYSVGKYIVDFYRPEKKLAIEIDGDTHYNEQAKRYDSKREIFIANYGIKIIRFTNLEIIRNINGAIEKIMKSL